MKHAARVFALLQAAARLRTIADALDEASARPGRYAIRLAPSDAEVCAVGADALELLVEALGQEDVRQ
jgi:hypothetical protein